MTARGLPTLRRVNGMFALLQIAYWAMFAAFAGFQTALLLSRGFTGGQAGALGSIRCLAGIIAQPLLGGWADRHPQVSLNKILNLCLLGSLAVNLVFYLTRPGFFATALIFLSLGVLELNAYPLLDSMAVQFINAGMDVRYSLGRGLGSLAYAVACVVLGWQSVALGIESILVTHAALLVFLMLVTAAYPQLPKECRPVRGETAKPHSAWFLLRESRSYTLMLLATFFAMLAVLPSVSFMVSVVTARGGDNTHLGLALFFMASSELPAAFLFQKMWRKLGTRGMMVFAVTFMAIKPLTILLAPNLFWTLAVQPIQMLGYGLFTPASVYYANENVSDADRVLGQTMMMVASNGLGGVVGNLLGGFAVDRGGISSMLILCIACGAVGIALALLAVRASGKKAERT